jgi:hypothetical protein
MFHHSQEDENEEWPLLVDPSDAAARQYLASGDSAAFADARHPDVPLLLLQRIECSDSALTNLKISNIVESTEASSRALARALSLNTLITSLDLSCNVIGPVAACLIFTSMTHLTSLTRLDLGGCSLTNPSIAADVCGALMHLTSLTRLDLGGSSLMNRSSAADVCGALMHLTSLTRLDLTQQPRSWYNFFEVSHICCILKHHTLLTALTFNSDCPSDIAFICASAAAAGLVRLKQLFYVYNMHPELYEVGDLNFYRNAIVRCGAWSQFNLPQPSNDIVQRCIRNHCFAPLLSYLLRPLRLTMSLVLNAAAACTVFGPRSSVHYLQPPAQLRCTSSLHWLEVAAQQPACSDNKQRLQLLNVGSPLSFVALRLAGTRAHHRRRIDDRVIAHIIKRRLSASALRFWTSASHECNLTERNGLKRSRFY